MRTALRLMKDEFRNETLETDDISIAERKSASFSLPLLVFRPPIESSSAHLFFSLTCNSFNLIQVNKLC